MKKYFLNQKIKSLALCVAAASGAITLAGCNLSAPSDDNTQNNPDVEAIQLQIGTEVEPAKLIKSQSQAVIKQSIAFPRKPQLAIASKSDAESVVHLNEVEVISNDNIELISSSFNRNDLTEGNNAQLITHIAYKGQTDLPNASFKLHVKVDGAKDIETEFDHIHLVPEINDESGVEVKKTTVYCDGKLVIKFKLDDSLEPGDNLVLDIAKGENSQWFYDAISEFDKQLINEQQQIVIAEHEFIVDDNGFSEIVLHLDVDKLASHKEQLLDNVNTGGLIHFDASDIKQKNIDIDVNLAPVTFSEDSVFFARSDDPITLRLTNHTNKKLNGFTIADENSIKGITVSGLPNLLNPGETVDVELNASVEAAANKKPLKINYQTENKNKIETVELSVTVANAQISVKDIESRYLPTEGEYPVYTLVSNTGDFNWYPAARVSANAYYPKINHMPDTSIDGGLPCDNYVEDGLPQGGSCLMLVDIVKPKTIPGTKTFKIISKAKDGSFITNLDKNIEKTYQFNTVKEGITFQKEGEKIDKLEIPAGEEKVKVTVFNDTLQDIHNIQAELTNNKNISIVNNSCTEELGAKLSCDITLKVKRDGIVNTSTSIVLSAKEITTCLLPSQLTLPIEIKVKERVIFATDGLYDGNLGGQDGANAICQKEAKEKGFKGDFTAILSQINLKHSYDQEARYVTVVNNESTVLYNINTMYQTLSDVTPHKALHALLPKDADNKYAWFLSDPRYTAIASCEQWHTNSNTLGSVTNASDKSFLNQNPVLEKCSTQKHLYCMQK
ncbi:hypothetical protein [Cysteiniphilum sp. JM-1]|uniref:COG1470 family protein n=1 Tax=Cysteiniphilum sp. JM-1 TaxID=2610891 RepID=UPI001248BED7|nr:hypothetical protein [Cysteiniphilum sp. JM-1]